MGLTKKHIGFIVFILLLTALLTFVYLKNKDNSPPLEEVEFSIRAEYENKVARTGIKINGENYTIDGYELILLPKGEFVTIENFNLDNQTFYTRTEQVNVTNLMRYDFQLEKPEEIKITHKGVKPIEVKLEGNMENPFLCIDYSFAYFKVKIDYPEIKKPDRFKRWEGCYQLDSIEEEKLINVSWLKYSTETDEDFINISVGINEFEQLDKIAQIK